MPITLPNIQESIVNTSPTNLSTPPPVDLVKIPNAIQLGDLAQQKFLKDNSYKKYESLFTPIAETPNDVSQRYNNPSIGYSAFNPDIEQDYADKQSWYKALGNNLTGFSSRALATFLGGFSDIPDTAEAIGTQSLDAFTNTSWKNQLNDWAESLSNKFPVYETRYAAEHPYLSYINPLELKSMMNKWGTVANNLGFTVGAITNAIVTDAAIGLVTGGTGEVALMPKQLSTIAKSIWELGKSFEYGKSAANLTKILSTPSNILKELNTISKTNSLMTSTRLGLNLYNSAVGEASVEAYNNLKEQKQNLTNEYIKIYGSHPLGEDLEVIEKNAQASANTTFLANTALLLATNYLSFGKILNPTSSFVNQAERELVKDAFINTSIDAVGVAPKATKMVDKFVKGLKHSITNGTLKTMATEGFEEGAQYSISQSTKDFYTSKYRNSDDADILFKSLAKGVQDTLFTEQGHENIIMGALSGPLIHGFSSVYNKGKAKIKGERYIPQKNKAIEQALNLMNSTAGLTGSITNLHSELSTQLDIQKRFENAVYNGDIDKAHNLKSDAFFNWIHSANKYGQFELRMQAMEDAKKLKDEDFANFWGIDFTNTNSKTAERYIDKLQNKAKEFKEISDIVESSFGKNPFNYRKDTLKYKAFEDYKQALAHSLVEVKDSENRMNEIKADISNKLSSLDFDFAIKLVDPNGLLDIVDILENKINNLNISIESTQTLPSLNQKLLNEKNFLKENLDNIKNIISGNETSIDTYKKSFNNLINYFNDPTLANKVNDTDNLFEKLTSLNKLQSRIILANNTYNSLRTSSGFENFYNDVLNTVHGEYTKRLEVKDGKLYINPKGKQEPEEDLTQLVTDAAKNSLKNDPEYQEILNTIDSLPENDDEAIYEKALEKMDNAEPLTKEESDAVELRRALTRKREIELEKQDQLKPKKTEIISTVVPAEQVTIGDEITYNGKDMIVSDIKKNTDGTVDILEVLNPEGKIETIINAKPDKKEFVLELKSTMVVSIDGNEEVITTNKKVEESNSIDNLFGNVVEFLDNTEDVKEFKKIKSKVENPSLKFVSNIYTNYILKSPIFKFIFGDKLLIGSSSIVLTTNTEATEDYSKIGETKLYRKKSTKQAILKVNEYNLGYISDSSNIYVVKDNSYVQLSSIINNITDTEFQELTGYSKDKFEEFKQKFNDYNSLSNKIFSNYKENEEVILDNIFVANNLVLSPTIINSKLVNKQEDATLLKDIKALGENSYIISNRKIFTKNKNGEYENENQINIIGKRGMLNQKDIDNDPSLKNLLEDQDFINKLLANNSRYHLLNRLPNGQFNHSSRVVARPVNLKDNILEELFTALKIKDINNLSSIVPQIFIAERFLPKGNGLSIEFNVDPLGNTILNINQNIKDNSKNIISIDLNDISNESEDVDEFLELLNMEIQQQKRDAFNISAVTRSSFKKFIKNDEEAKFNDFFNNITVATTPYFFNKIKLTIKPKSSNANTEIIEKNVEENLVKSEKIVIFGKEYDPSDTDNILKARILEKELKNILPQLQDNKTITRTNCK